MTKKIKSNKEIKKILNIGCGPIKYHSEKEDELVINIDKEPFWKPDMVRDVEKGLPFDDNSIEAIFSSYFLEHVNPANIDFFMYECWRVLKNKKKFSCIVPIGVSWMSSPYHVTPMSERTPLFFTIYSHPEITGYNFKLLSRGIKKGKDNEDKIVDWTDELHFVLEVIKDDKN